MRVKSRLGRIAVEWVRWVRSSLGGHRKTREGRNKVGVKDSAGG